VDVARVLVVSGRKFCIPNARTPHPKERMNPKATCMLLEDKVTSDQYKSIFIYIFKIV